MAAFVKSPGNGVMPGEVFNLIQYGCGKSKSTTLTVGINDLIVVTSNSAGTWSSPDVSTQISSGATFLYSFIPRSTTPVTAVGIWKATSTSVTINLVKGQYGYGVYRNSIYSNIVYKESATDLGSSSTIDLSLHNLTKGDIFIGSYTLSSTTVTPWQIGLTGISSRGDFLTRAWNADGASMTILGVISDSTVIYKTPAGKGGYAIFSVN